MTTTEIVLHTDTQDDLLEKCTRCDRGEGKLMKQGPSAKGSLRFYIKHKDKKCCFIVIENTKALKSAAERFGIPWETAKVQMIADPRTGHTKLPHKQKSERSRVKSKQLANVEEEEEQEEREKQHGKFNINPEDYLMEDLYKYHRDLLYKIIEHLDKENKILEDSLMKSDGQLNTSNKKIEELQKRLNK